MPSRYEGDPIPCPHCPDGHQRPDWGRWAVWISEARDGDGQPTTVHVGRADGAHVAEADAQWIRDILNQRLDAVKASSDRSDSTLEGTT